MTPFRRAASEPIAPDRMRQGFLQNEAICLTAEHVSDGVERGFEKRRHGKRWCREVSNSVERSIKPRTE
jgi:hypothetical protein